MIPDTSKLIVHVPRRYTSNSWGGTERVLEQTLPLMTEFGFNSMIYTTQALDDSVADEVAGIPITRFPYFYPEWPLSAERKLRYDNKGGNLLSLSLASSLNELKDISLVHLHTGNLLGAQCYRVAKSKKNPIIITLHGGHFAIPQEELKSLAYVGKTDPKKGFRWGRGVSLFLRTRQLLKHMDAVLCVGIDEYEAAKKSLPGQRVYFIPGGVNIDEFSNADRNRGRRLLGIDSKRLLIVCVARVDHQKDQATLVKAWRNQLSSECDLALIGPETSPGYVDKLTRLGKNANGRLYIVGGVDPADIPHVYAAGDVSVLPSRHEPFGLTCLESWAAGIPLIAADVGGPGWLLKDGREGMLFPVGDEGLLGKALLEMLADSELRKRYALNGLERAKQEFSWGKQAERLSDIYNIVLEAYDAK